MKTVLVVDDEKLIRWSLTEALRDQYVVFTADSGEQAMDILGRVPVDAVVTDLKMPGLDGMGLVDILHRKRPDLKVFVITAYAAEPVVKHLLSLGVKECIAKPFDVAAVRRLLEHHIRADRAPVPATAP